MELFTKELRKMVQEAVDEQNCPETMHALERRVAALEDQARWNDGAVSLLLSTAHSPPGVSEMVEEEPISYCNAGKLWNSAEDFNLATDFRKAMKRIARKHKRTSKAIQCRVFRLYLAGTLEKGMQ